MNEKNVQGRVIITSVRSLMALVVAQSLGKRNIDLIGADCIDINLLTFSKYVHKHESYTNYLLNEDKFLDDLEKIIVKYKPTDDRPYLLMPVFRETSLIIKHRELFERNITVACPDNESINKIHPKHHFAETTKKLGIQVPKTSLPDDRDEVKRISSELTYPSMIKPYNESGGKGIQKVSNQQELLKTYDEHMQEYPNPPLIQEMVDGEDYCFAAICEKGKIKAHMAYKNIQRFPASSGSGVMRETKEDAPFLEDSKKLLKAIGWNGVCQIDFLWDNNPQHKPNMIEVNPRYWAGLFQSVKSGIDFPWLNFQLYAFNKISDAGNSKTGIKTKLPMAWFLSVLDENINVKRNLEQIEESGKNALQELQKNGQTNDSFREIIHNLKDGIDLTNSFEHYQSAIKHAQNAESEIFSKEDPTAALGLIYVVLYLFKYKKLPPEMGV